MPGMLNIINLVHLMTFIFFEMHLLTGGTIMVHNAS